MKVLGFIPSRYGSVRFKAKALALIAGKPMVQWVYENAKKATKLDDLFILTDDERIATVCQNFGGKFIMTDPACKSGTERILSVINDLDCDIALNIQGDEPLVKSADLDNLIASFTDSSVLISTLVKKIPAPKENPNIVKVVKDVFDNAIYFSRSTIPFNRDNLANLEYFQHIGIYAYTKTILQKFNDLKGQNLEKIEMLEQLRFLENGYKIRTVETQNTYIGVDTEEDAKEVAKIII